MSSPLSDPDLVIRPYGREAILVELASVEEMVSLQTTLGSLALDGVTDVLPGARTVLVRFSPAQASAAGVAAAVRAAAQHAGEGVETASTVRTVIVPMAYDGPDLDYVAATAGLSIDEVVRRHSSRDYVVAFIGFAPGFYFLAGGDPDLQMPRRESPRTRLRRGSVGLAGEFTGIYPRQSPGGWQIIGHTEAELWDLAVQPSATLMPGTRVRFEAIDS
jgi:KipI family sensor histidine kinase inhibitor